MDLKEVKPENDSKKLLIEEQNRKKEADKKRNYLIGGIIVVLATIITMFIVQGVKIKNINNSIADVNIKELSNKVDTMSKNINTVVMPSLSEYNSIMQEFKQRQNDFASKNEFNSLNSNLSTQEKKLAKIKKDFEKYVRDHYKSDDKGVFKMPTSKELKKLETEFLKKTTQDSINNSLKKPFTIDKPIVTDKPIVIEKPVNDKPSVDVISDILVADTTVKAAPKNLKSNQTKIRFEKFFGIKK